jgi:DNA-binding transcriptional ArsR family regulator
MREDSQSHRSIPTDEQVDLAVEVFRMLSDSTRVRLLWALLDGELSVNELAEVVDKAPTGVSQHLAKLRMARLVQTRRQANQVFYRVATPHVTQLVTASWWRTRSITPSTPAAESPSTTGVKGSANCAAPNGEASDQTSQRQP